MSEQQKQPVSFIDLINAWVAKRNEAMMDNDGDNVVHFKRSDAAEDTTNAGRD